MTDTITREAIAKIRTALEERLFVCRTEAELQDAVSRVLNNHPTFAFQVVREVIARVGRFDLLVTVTMGEASKSIVLELKLYGTVPDVLRQVSRYAKTDGVDGVALVTTSRRLVAKMAPYHTVETKPFDSIAVRTSF